MVFLRKALHTLLALTLALFAPVIGVAGVAIVGAALIALFAGTYQLRVLDPVRQAEKASFGEFWFALGLIAMALFILPQSMPAFQAGLLTLGFADPLAAIVGKRWGRRVYRVWGERRTYEGSLTCLVVSVGFFLVFGLAPVAALGGAVAVAAVEALAPRGSDNLLIPLVAGALVLMLA